MTITPSGSCRQLGPGSALTPSQRRPCRHLHRAPRRRRHAVARRGDHSPLMTHEPRPPLALGDVAQCHPMAMPIHADGDHPHASPGVEPAVEQPELRGVRRELEEAERDSQVRAAAVVSHISRPDRLQAAVQSTPRSLRTACLASSLRHRAGSEWRTFGHRAHRCVGWSCPA
jgi:hypothetical protein